MRLSKMLRFAVVIMVGVGCSSSRSNSSGGANCSNPGGPVSGATDTHCSGQPAVVVNPAACKSAATEDDAGTGGAEFGDTMYNTDGDDDDCKFHVHWSATALCENADVTVSVLLTNKTDGSAASGATPWADIYLGAQTHEAPLTNQTFHEPLPGHYTIGPVRFDAPGQWTMRFHFYPNDCDFPESPHAHVAFYVNVP